MESFSIQKDGEFLTGNMRTGRYEFTGNKEIRYTFEESRAKQISEQFPGSKVVRER